MKGYGHRKKGYKHRNGRTRYEKGLALHDRHPSRKLIKGYRGTTEDAPATDEPMTTLGDLWPREET